MCFESLVSEITNVFVSFIHLSSKVLKHTFNIFSVTKALFNRHESLTGVSDSMTDQFELFWVTKSQPRCEKYGAVQGKKGLMGCKTQNALFLFQRTRPYFISISEVIYIKCALLAI